MPIQELGAVHSLQRGDQGPTLPHPGPPTQIQHAGCSGQGRGQPQNSASDGICKSGPCVFLALAEPARPSCGW